MTAPSTNEGNTRMLTIRKAAVTVAAVGALGLGGAGIAGAADSNGSSGSSSSGTTTTKNRHDRAPQEALSSEVAAKVKAATLAKVPGATVLRTEAGGPYGTAYHAHIRTSDGTLKVVLVNAKFEATAVQADRGPGRGRGDHDGHHGGRDETPLTGDTKQKVEDAVLAKYPGATIVRSETNADGGSAYEAHITTTGGKQLEVLVNQQFEVVGADERPAHP